MYQVMCYISARYLLTYALACGRCRRTEAAMPQVVLARPSWSSSENSFCSVGLNTSLELGHDDVSAVTGAVYIKAVMDHKYDGIQLRDLTVSMVRRRRANDDDDAVDTLREAVLHLPVNSFVFYRATIVRHISRLGSSTSIDSIP